MEAKIIGKFIEVQRVVRPFLMNMLSFVGRMKKNRN